MLRWLQFGDLHACEGDGWASLRLFETLVDEANAGLLDHIDFAVLPGDNANHATAEQFERVAGVAARLELPLFILPGDHDYEAGHLADFRGLLAPAELPRVEIVRDARILLLDIVSAGSGGPDFRLGQKQSRWLSRTLQDAFEGPTVAFMHAFPGDLREGSDEVAALFAEAGVAYVGTGHTHYNDLLNDGHVVYGATRSTGEIEEGPPGFSLSALDGDVVSWRFRTQGRGWPFVLITSPSDIRLVVDPQSRGQVPEGFVEARAEIFGAGADAQVTAVLAGVDEQEMRIGPDSVWSCRFENVADGLHTLRVTATGTDGSSDTDTVEVLARSARERPRRGPAVALGRDVHSVRFWPSHGIPGGRLGPNSNGHKW